MYSENFGISHASLLPEKYESILGDWNKRAHSSRVVTDSPNANTPLICIRNSGRKKTLIKKPEI